MADAITDARGVEISPGDTVIYGFAVGRSIAMAEGIVLGDRQHYNYRPGELGFPECKCGQFWPCSKVKPGPSLTPSGMLYVKIVRRSFGSGTKPIVHVQPGRVIVLKQYENFRGQMMATLPDSPEPTQAEEARKGIERMIGAYTEDLRDVEASLPNYWRDGAESKEERIISWSAFCTSQLAVYRKQLRDLED